MHAFLHTALASEAPVTPRTLYAPPARGLTTLAAVPGTNALLTAPRQYWLGAGLDRAELTRSPLR